MTDYIEDWEKSVTASWGPYLLKLAVAVALVLIIYWSILPIKEQVSYYNTFVQIGNCLCPPSNLRLLG